MRPQYRARFTNSANPNPERPVEAYFTDIRNAHFWRDTMLLVAAPNSSVTLYQTVEQQVGLWVKPDPPKPDPPKLEPPPQPIPIPQMAPPPGVSSGNTSAGVDGGGIDPGSGDLCVACGRFQLPRWSGVTMARKCYGCGRVQDRNLITDPIGKDGA